jgi:hypothetical protein
MAIFTYGVIYSWKYGNLQVKIWHVSKQAFFDVAQVDHDNVTVLKFSMPVNLYHWHLILFHLLIYSFIYLFIYLYIYAFIYLFIHSFTSIYTITCEMYVENMKL